MQTGVVTFDQFLTLPDPPSGHLELRRGEVVVVTPPKFGHQRLQNRIATLLNARIVDKGTVLCNMVFRPTAEYDLRQADVGCVLADRAAGVREDEYLLGAPELVIEVSSPSDTMIEILDTIDVCLSNGCVSFWVVADKQRMVSVTEGKVTQHYRIGMSVPLPLPFEGVIPVADIFGS